MISSYSAITLIIVALVTAVVFYKRRKAYYKPLKNLPGGTPPTLLVEILSWIQGIRKAKGLNGVDFTKRLIEEAAKYQEIGMHCSWNGLRPIVSIYNAEIAKLVLRGGISNKKVKEYRFFQKIFGTGLLTSEGEKWKQRKKLLTPCFHIRILEGFFPVFNRQSLLLIEKLKSHSDKEYVDITPLSNLCSLDVICETLMGVSVGAQKGNGSEYVQALHNSLSIIIQHKIRPRLRYDFLFGFTKMGRTLERDVDLLHNFTKKIINEKKEELLSVGNSSENDGEGEGGYHEKTRKKFLDLLLHMNMNGGHLSDVDIREEVDTFMIAGFETSALGISYALYCIGLHPEVQKNISEELDGIFEEDIDRPVTLEDTRKMKYLECVIKESLRLFPPGPSFLRILGEDVEFESLKIPKGTTVRLNILALHRSPQVFPNPETFDPERFLPENSSGRHPYAFIPFSAGPRNCIGQNFAMLEMKAVLCNIIRHLSFVSLDTRDNFHVKAELTLKPAQEVRLKFSPKT